MPSCTPAELETVINNYLGGSTARYRHPLNPRFILTEGAYAVAEAAQAHWLTDIVATEFAPHYAQEWLKGRASVGVVTVKVEEDGRTCVSLLIEDSQPEEKVRRLDMSTFPVGEWTFYLGTDEVAPDSYITTMMVPSEY